MEVSLVSMLSEHLQDKTGWKSTEIYWGDSPQQHHSVSRIANVQRRMEQILG